MTDVEGVATRSADQPIKRRSVLAWALWDWGSSAYSTIVVSFVFAPYLTEVVARDRPPGR